ncbi:MULTISPECIES: hypothetical protein [Nocardia]|uniref:hypothetical protein n=1 Tax=Nocardia TaxID=1817 RepID=UPI0013003F61|nr:MULTISPECIES: hypothetical protein [Nocardia]
MDYRQLFVEISKRPGIYGLDGSFGQFVAFLNGVDAGNDWRLLTGFREWLVVRLGDGNNLVWSGLVLHLAFPSQQSGWRELVADPQDNRIAVDMLFGLLDEFLTRRTEHGELVRIFDEYLTWLKAQSWS